MTAKKRPAHERPRRSRNADATRAAFVAAGEKVFAERGFDGATLDMLAADAGANKALVSYYFGSKEGLYDVVIATLVGETVAAVMRGFQPRGDAAADFRNYVVALAAAIAGRPTFSSILMREYIAGSMQARKKPAQEILQFYRLTEARYEAGRRAKIFRKTDPHLLHLSIIGPIIHFTLTARFREETFGKVIGDLSNPSTAAFARHLSALMLGGLRRTD